MPYRKILIFNGSQKRNFELATQKLHFSLKIARRPYLAIKVKEKILRVKKQPSLLQVFRILKWTTKSLG